MSIPNTLNNFTTSASFGGAISRSSYNSNTIDGLCAVNHVYFPSELQSSHYGEYMKPLVNIVRGASWACTIVGPSPKSPQKLDPASPQIKLLKKIRQISKIKDDWAGKGTVGATLEACNEAEIFLSQLPLNNIALPHISLAEDGELNFTWNTDAGKIDVGFYGEGFYSYYAVSSAGTEYFANNLPITETLSDKAIKIITK